MLDIDDLVVKPYIHTKVCSNEFVENVVRDNIGTKKNQPPSSEK